jgi:dipeptidyl aminopeptidase/acylaminoacyl peptidase
LAGDAKFATTGPLTVDALVDITPPSEPHLSPDGSRIAYLQSVGETRQVFVVPVSGGWPSRITAGELSCDSPRWSPDGASLAFVRGKALLVAEADGGSPRTLTEQPAGISMPRWSPDGTTIAFYSRRRGWSQIWLIGVAGGEPRRLTNLPEDNDDLQWSPDGTQILYSSIRGDDLNNRDIYCVDVASGEERCLTPVSGCFDGAPSWSPDGGTIAFLSDQDGYVHVHLMDPDGSRRRQLTFGPAEDGWPSLARGALLWSRDGERLAFIRNRQGMFDLVGIAISGGPLERYSREDGFWQPFAWLPGGDGLVCTIARPDGPPDLCEVTLQGRTRRITRSLAGGLRGSHFVLPERVEYRSADGLAIGAFLYRPRGREPNLQYPAIVHLHGGPTSQSYFTWGDPLVQLFAQEGYAVFEPDFRGSSGYGRAFRFANKGAWGVMDAQDCLDGAAYLAGLDWIDGARIGVWGGSYGGYLALCCLVRAPATFRAAIDLYGDSEIAESYLHGDRAGRLDLQRQMGRPDASAESYRAGSPVYAAERIEAPLLILHGSDDARVPPIMSERMVEALRIEGKYFEHRFYEGEGHGFRRASTRRDAYQRILAFFDTHLKGSG